MYQVDLVFKEVTADYKNGNTLVVDLEFKETNVDYELGNALVVRTSLIEMERTNFLKIVDLW